MWNLYGSYGSFYFHLKHTQTMSNSGVLHPEDRFTSLVANICILTVVRMSCWLHGRVGLECKCIYRREAFSLRSLPSKGGDALNGHSGSWNLTLPGPDRGSKPSVRSTSSSSSPALSFTQIVVGDFSHSQRQEIHANSSNNALARLRETLKHSGEQERRLAATFPVSRVNPTSCFLDFPSGLSRKLKKETQEDAKNRCSPTQKEQTA